MQKILHAIMKILGAIATWHLVFVQAWTSNINTNIYVLKWGYSVKLLEKVAVYYALMLL
jgi:hypothetical protein